MTPIRYGSVCSGIEAASLAWEPLGMEPAWFAEIEPFPSAVLDHHWPHVTNYGDMTLLKGRIAFDELEAPDVLVGGTPCQAFSVSGARAGLDDPRGRLTISYVELADEIDKKRRELGKPECIAVWENVPGILSSKDNAFGSFLGLLAGEDCALVPPGKRWTNAGCVFGPERAIAWRIIDAQYFGVAQRRRRVFLVASAREGFDPCQVLFELDGLRRDSAPSREAGAVTAALTANGVGVGGADDNQGRAGHLIAAFGQNNTRGPVQISHCLNAHSGPHGRLDFESETFLVQTVHGTQDPDTAVEMAHTLGCNQGQENAVLTQFGTEIAGTLTARHDSSPCADRGMNEVFAPAAAYPILEVGKRTGTSTTDPRAGLGIGHDGDPMFTLQAGAQHGVVTFAADVAPTLRAGGNTTGGDRPPGTDVDTAESNVVIGYVDCGNGGISPSEPMGTLVADSPSGGGRPLPAVAFQSSQSGVRLHDTHATLDANNGSRRHNGVVAGTAVRRLTPIECERLQGMPDGHTLIQVAKRNKLIEDELAYLRRHRPDLSEEEAHRMAADGPRYKAIGNSKAVPCVRWLGARLLAQLDDEL